MTTNRAELVETSIVLARELPAVGVLDLRDTIIKLVREARIIQHYAEVACERDLFPTEASRETGSQQRVRHLAESIGCGVILSEDVRGFPIKLILPSGKSNSFGGIGWGIPY